MLRVENLDLVGDFMTMFIRSPLIEQFLKLNIVEDEAVLLEGTFYLNNNPRKQKILLRTDMLYFMPSQYTIPLKLCKVYQMKTNHKNYLVFNSFM